VSAALQVAKRAASDLWLGHIPGVEAVRSGERDDGTPAIIVSWRGPGDRPAGLPTTFQGFPVIVEVWSDGIRPLDRPPQH
jgi:hypothetical protein